LKNLRLAYTNWTTPGRDGLIATQAVQGRGYSALDDRGIIEARFADNLSVTNCELVGTGFHGIVFSTGVKNESGVRGKAGLLQ